MALPPCSTNLDATLVADTSVVINLNATGCAEAILRRLPQRLKIVDAVQTELSLGQQRDRDDYARLEQLVESGLIEVVTFQTDDAYSLFESLVVGPAAVTLDDGEAATIAYAVAHDATAIIDERKANRICNQRFPTLELASTVDLLSHPAVYETLGREALADAVFGALSRGRMRVFPEHRKWVMELIGNARAANCASLPQALRFTGTS